MKHIIPIVVLVLTLPFADGNASDFDIFLDSTIELNADDGTITLPLFRGTHDGDDVFYIITESSDRDDAERQGVNWSPKLANAIGTSAVQMVGDEEGSIVFAGTVDFSLFAAICCCPEYR